MEVAPRAGILWPVGKGLKWAVFQEVLAPIRTRTGDS